METSGAKEVEEKLQVHSKVIGKGTLQDDLILIIFHGRSSYKGISQGCELFHKQEAFLDFIEANSQILLFLNVLIASAYSDLLSHISLGRGKKFCMPMRLYYALRDQRHRIKPLRGSSLLYGVQARIYPQ